MVNNRPLLYGGKYEPCMAWSYTDWVCDDWRAVQKLPGTADQTLNMFILLLFQL